MMGALGLSIKVENIPPDLKALAQWVAWRYERRGEKRTKVPYDPRSETRAKANDPATWTGFKVALKRVQTGGFDGVGFFFSHRDPYCGIDLDDCMGGDGRPVPAAREILEQVASYSEVSPSGRGVKIFTRGYLPDGKGRRTTPEGFGQIETYDSGRFFTVTGWRLPEFPETIEEGQGAVDRIYVRYFARDESRQKAGDVSSGHTCFPGSDDGLVEKGKAGRNGAKFAQLWHGDTTGYPSHSEADLALCRLLAFYAGPDPARIDRIFRRSGLCRDKWIERADYREPTIAKAIEACREFYMAGGGKGDQAREPAAVPACPRHEGPHGIRLIATQCDRKPKSLHVWYCVELTDVEIGEVVVTTTKRGPDDALRRLLEMIEDQRAAALSRATKTEIRKWANLTWRTRVLEKDESILRRRQETLAALETRDARDMVAIATEHMRDKLGLAFVGTRGAVWSEKLGRSIEFGGFVRLGGSGLLDALREARDFQPPSTSSPTRHIQNAERVIRTAWSNIVGNLPDELGAQLGPESRAAQEMRNKIVGLWTAPENWGRRGDQRTSLAGVVRGEMHAGRRGTGARWQRVLPSVDAWFQLGSSAGDSASSARCGVWIAMRSGLGRGQIKGHVIECVASQRSLRELARRYGFAHDGGDPDNRIPLEGGRRVRAVVLSQALTDEILFGIRRDDPDDRPTEPLLSTADAESPVTEGRNHSGEAGRAPPSPR